jgi:hypothetical protein
LSARKCSVFISTLEGSPYLLVWGATVYAKVSATNIRGTSSLSPEGSGGNIADSPDIPINFASTAATSALLIGLSWSPGPTWYGLDVHDYALSYD